MTKQKCPHGSTLPRGLVCDRGYISIRIEKNKEPYYFHCGTHTKAVEVLAIEKLAQIRSEIMRGKFGYVPELPEKLFDEVAELFLLRWKEERDGSGKLKHNPRSIHNFEWRMRESLIPYFGKRLYHTITTVDIEKRRQERIAGKKLKTNIWEWEVKPVLGTSVNREHVPLSSMFSNIKAWMDQGVIEKFKIPAENPCESATKAELRTHDRILSDYEIKKLFLACKTVGDMDMYQIVDMILTTVLSKGDVEKLERGQQIDILRSKTGVGISMPVTVLEKLNFSNWDARWKKVRTEAGLSIDRKSPDYVDARVLRKTGINWVIDEFGVDKASPYAGHASVKTTEQNYRVAQREKMRPIAEFMQQKMKKLREGL